MGPWIKTVREFTDQGLNSDFTERLCSPELPTENLFYTTGPYEEYQRYYNTMKTDVVCDYETSFGWDPLKRVSFRIPFISYDAAIIEDTPEYMVRYDRDGWVRRYVKGRDLVQEMKPVVEDWKSWEAHKQHTREQLVLNCTPENMEKAYGKYREGDEHFSIRFRLSGFFWLIRDLMGVEEHLVNYMLEPDLIKDINRFQLDIYKEQLAGILDIIKPSTLFFEEDYSGANGPMISPETFAEFISPCYREIIPFLKERGVGQVFLDTDGDFTLMIPEMMACGIDGVLPVDVNAGVDIIKVREAYPSLKFWGGFDKLALVSDTAAIEAEFRRLMPVIRQGGCIICTDHQAAPHTPLENYRYYVRRLREVMAECRGTMA
ncbi:MAG: hypothetical protein LUC93_05005 [Planctomycetaceae bacterium]|nr:hypothetical protein [Planctomycetaceae bacterium]